MIDAIHEIGQRVYPHWTPSILEDKPDFPYPSDHSHSFVSRRLVVWSYKPGDPSWDMAFGAYAMLVEALSEGVVHAVAEGIPGAVVPPLYPNDTQRVVYGRERVPIPASEWRRDSIMLSVGMVRGWWGLVRLEAHPPEPPWIVLIDRETLADYLERYADVLTEATAADATRQRGRRPDVPLAQLEREILTPWLAGELGSKFAAVWAFIMQRYGVGRTTARNYCKRLGIHTDGVNATPMREGKKSARRGGFVAPSRTAGRRRSQG